MAEWTEKRKVIHHYDYSASTYDVQYEEEQDAKIKAVLANINLRKDNILLDAGCGTGLLFKHVGKSTKSLVGLDVSSKILKKAKKRAKHLLTVAVVRADADFMPFQNKIFDAAFAITLLQNAPNPLATLHEMKRVSKDHAVTIATGLRKHFSQETFVKLLHKAGLKVYIPKTSRQSKEIIAICRKVDGKNT